MFLVQQRSAFLSPNFIVLVFLSANISIGKAVLFYTIKAITKFRFLSDNKSSEFVSKILIYLCLTPDLKTEEILNQFENAQDRHAAYREEIQRYSQEEARLWEDLRHGFILGTKNFVEVIRRRFLPATPEREIPQQMDVKKNLDLEQILERAIYFLGWDGDFKKTPRVSPDRVLARDLLLYLIWQLGVRTNSQIGELFGLTGSAISRRVRIFKSRLSEDSSLPKK